LYQIRHFVQGGGFFVFIADLSKFLNHLVISRWIDAMPSLQTMTSIDYTEFVF
jgi:hypothetical protein